MNAGTFLPSSARSEAPLPIPATRRAMSHRTPRWAAGLWTRQPDHWNSASNMKIKHIDYVLKKTWNWFKMKKHLQTLNIYRFEMKRLWIQYTDLRLFWGCTIKSTMTMTKSFRNLLPFLPQTGWVLFSSSGRHCYRRWKRPNSLATWRQVKLSLPVKHLLLSTIIYQNILYHEDNQLHRKLDEYSIIEWF